MDTSATTLVEDLNDILSDFKAHMIEAYEEKEEEMEEKIDNVIKEVNELFSSSYT